jgi:hypothetical protein
VITLLVMTDGRREYLAQTLASFDHFVTGKITRRVIHDDSGDPEYKDWLRYEYGAWDSDIIDSDERLGYSRAVQRAWQYLEGDTNRFTFHLEDDFMFNRPVDLDELVEFLDQKWWLAQIALRRGAWGREQRGFVEDSPSAYKQCLDGEHAWLEHRLYYTMTPHLYRSRLRKVGWPDGIGSEIHFKDKLLQEGLPWNVSGTNVRFGFWGGIEDGANAVTHIGYERLGHGY